MVLPAFLILLAVAFYPLVMSFRLSFSQYSLNRPQLGIRYVGFQNFINILKEPDMRSSFGVTFRYSLAVVGIGIFLASFLAGALNKAFFWHRVARTLVLLPMLLSPLASGLMWRLMYDYKYGIFNYFVVSLGLDKVMWLGQESIAIWSVIVAGIWRNMPFSVLLLLAGLQSLPMDLYEAARIDGASRWQLFSRITVPLIAPIFMIVIMIRTMDSIRTFDLIWALTEGGPGISTEVVSIFAYKNAFQFFDMGTAAGAAVMLFIISGIICVIYLRVLWRKELA